VGEGAGLRSRLEHQALRGVGAASSARLGVEHQEGDQQEHADDEGDVGDVEVGPGGAALGVVDLDEVDDAVLGLAVDEHLAEQAVVEVAERAADDAADRDEAVEALVGSLRTSIAM
jgi:hypothetical protein